MKTAKEMAQESALKWCDENPMNKRGSDGLTSWGVYGHGFIAGFDCAIEMLRSEEAEKKFFEILHCLTSRHPKSWADWLEKQRGDK